ncbi:hypothetical protein BDZ89DRAFT_1060668 [Hymenopellis radicata]|nr:hypothetical protein BDZ89DRAFT_1060668 [Hymenopellis radicata]
MPWLTPEMRSQGYTSSASVHGKQALVLHQLSDFLDHGHALLCGSMEACPSEG